MEACGIYKHGLATTLFTYIIEVLRIMDQLAVLKAYLATCHAVIRHVIHPAMHWSAGHMVDAQTATYGESTGGGWWRYRPLTDDTYECPHSAAAESERKVMAALRVNGRRSG